MTQIRIFLIFLLITIAGALLASDLGNRETGTPTDLPSTLKNDIAVLLETRNTSLTELNTRLENASSETVMLEILQAIKDHKIGTEVAILRLQKRHAELAGNQEAVTLIGTAIERLLEPPAVLGNAEARAASAQRKAGGKSHD